MSKAKPGGKASARRKRIREMDAQYKPFLERLVVRDAPLAPRASVSTTASPVVIHRSDGTTEQMGPYTAAQLAGITKERVPLTDQQRRAVYRRDKGRCRYCGRGRGPFHVDHVLPVVLGGTNAMDNLALACRRCNLKKGAQIWTPIGLTDG